MIRGVISRELGRVPVARRIVHHMDLPTLLQVNKEVVALTGEPHEFSPADREKLELTVAEVEGRANNQDLEESVPEKASLLIFKIASGQYFRAGNKRTALVAGLCFLRKNGYSIDIRNRDLVAVVDKVGMAAADLDDLYTVVAEQAEKAPTERKGWANAVTQTVESNRRFLRDLAS
jgi:prophage maintenance system killer protein